MKQQKILWVAVTLLFILNAGTLYLLLAHKPYERPARPGNRAFDRRVAETLDLTPEQQQHFDELKKEHHQAMVQLDAQMKQPFEQYFSLLQQAGDIRAKDSLERVISGIYLEKVKNTYEHFSKLKALCTPQQQQRFGALVPELMQVIAPRPAGRDPRNPPPPPPHP